MPVKRCCVAWPSAIDDYTFEVTAPEAVGYVLGIYGLVPRVPSRPGHRGKWRCLTEPENIATYARLRSKSDTRGSIVFVKNPFWPGSEGIGQANLTNDIRFMDNPVQLREYEADSMDVIFAPASELDRIRADSTLNAELSIVPGLCSQAWASIPETAFDNVQSGARSVSRSIARVWLIM